MKPVIPFDCLFIGARASEAMSQQDERDGVSRRRFLQAAASIISLHFGSHAEPALAHFGLAGATQRLGDELLALGAREAVTRIRSGDITAEAYVTQFHDALHILSMLTACELAMLVALEFSCS